MMFFKKKLDVDVETVLNNLTAQREEIKKRLEKMADVNKQLAESVKDTQVASSNLLYKLRGELKVAKKSITSICSKLKEGIILVDHTGKIIQLNRAGERIFNVSANTIVDKQFEEIISWLEPYGINTAGQKVKIKFKEDFFIKLSNKILIKVEQLSAGETRYQMCSDCLDKELPDYFSNSENPMNINVKCQDTDVDVTFDFSILDNDPNVLNDIIYIFIFRRTPADGKLRRYYENELKHQEHHTFAGK